ncbi:MAG: asparagine synthase (glutamine-hydrolyzing) [Planctomycetes bacterium]|nr:asparagine synthase (glutamine-hydrolyzing) [Planctomycetota bacterium]
MCGIAGMLGAGADDTRLATAMSERLAPRGPDAEGRWSGPGVLLAHRRLAVIDLSGGVQPMVSADGQTVIVFNGEIYNYRALRQELAAEGRACVDAGDTAVLLAAWQAWGPACLPRLRGMFAFAVWESGPRRLTLARDHAGIKPLYWFAAGGAMAFASEVKALQVHPACPREVDPTAVALYLECQYIPGSRSIWQSVQRLPPGHQLVIEDGQAPRQQRWHRPTSLPKLDVSEDEAVDLIHASLRQAVRSMLVADVPLGAFLSGGVDSSTIVALMAEVGPVDSFTLDFGDQYAGSEHRESTEVANLLGTRHHPLRITAQDVLGEMDRFQASYDEPFGDQAALPTLLLSRLTRRHVTVALSGEGADEVFGGYRGYLRRHGDPSRRSRWAWTAPLLRLLPAKQRGNCSVRVVTRGLARAWTTMPSVLPPEAHPQWFTPALRAAQQELLEDLSAAAYVDCDASDHTEQVMAVDRALWLPDDLLVKVDRATMAYGLEARVPYLDPDLLTLAARLPSALKLDGGRQTKHLLKRVASRHLPASLVYRRKQGFHMPLGDWLRGDLRELMEDCLGPGGLLRRGLLRPAMLSRLRDDHLRGKPSTGHRLWALMVLELWFRRWAPDWRLA